MLYKELHSTDTYMIRLPYSFSDYDRQLLTLFYQPLVGAESMSLYLTLWADGEMQSENQWTHYHLLNVLGLSLGKVFQARIALEAIGLLRTWQKPNGDGRSFCYELEAPLDAESFLKDPLLSMFLLNKIGESAYKQLRSRYIQTSNWQHEYTDVSRTFVDVFKPTTKTGLPASTEENFQSKTRNSSVPFYYEDFDFSLLQDGLSEQLVPKSAMTTEAKEVIAKLAFLYNLSPVEMQKVVILALDDELRLSDARLKKACAEYYKLTVSRTAPVIQKIEPASKVVQTDEKKLTKEEELIQYLETTAPAKVLKDIANGKEPILADVQLANYFVTHYKMPIGVVNVLLQYVLLRTDMKLTKNYAEKIASHWMRKDVKTAKEAMELARNEHEQYMKWKSEGSKQKTYSKKPTREEKVPDWFYKKDDELKRTGKETNGIQDIDAERQKLLEELGMMKR
ncbi:MULTISPECIES: DnaD domain protein [unclassified Psychrobacillus]|uniref:replication initiation and membrane attachment family protein n=1 Tax=unclassified Psychrobacillus TaxID=2636677 RepID=UPI001469DBFB|nr:MULTISPECIES: DnaD domain protein [unclassified Psychrobacillus]MCM3357678.1 DnaD domain protein [Psychrobacillus sp. MER TA 171]NME06585.1 helicase DnaB [Psychrobacillus sp. BL-248-WT-3]